MTDAIDVSKFSPEFIESFERLNLYFHVHHANEELLNNTLSMHEALEQNEGQTLSPEFLMDWFSTAGFVMQTVDALMHILQRKHVGPAYEFAKKLTDEQRMFIRDNVHSDGLTEMLAILNEDEETRTQRMLLEHLGIHE